MNLWIQKCLYDSDGNGQDDGFDELEFDGCFGSSSDADDNDDVHSANIGEIRE